MLILPLPARPDWKHPPVTTLAIMLLCLIAFLIQGKDTARSTETWRFYQESGLAKLEARLYQDDLKRRGEKPASGRPDVIFRTMDADRDFMQRLRADKIITPDKPEYAKWRADRTRFESLRGRLITENFALNGQEPRPVSLLTHMFLHGDVMHLSGNLAVLFVVGYTVEAALGPLGFLALYLLGGLGAALPDLLLPAAGHRLSIGASGAISAVMAAYLVLFGWRKINFFYWLFFVMGTVRWPAAVILPIWLTNELLQKFVFDRDGHVNYLAHFAGLVAGALLIGIYRWRRQGRSAEIVHRQDKEQAIDAIRLRAEHLVADLQFAPAALQYKKLFAEHPEADASVAAEYLHIARLTRQPELLADANRRLLLTASTSPASFAPTLLAEVLDTGDTPKLSARQWETLLSRLIDGQLFDAAEKLFLRLFAHPELRNALERPGNRLANAFIAKGEPTRAAPLHRLLAASPAHRAPGDKSAVPAKVGTQASPELRPSPE